MSNLFKKILTGLVPVILLSLLSVHASATAIDEAVKRYYAGFPDEAISMLKPLALSGDADAQYLLGNIIYSLSTVKGFNVTDDPVKWYKMSAGQNSAPASYALGVIFYNRWVKSRDKKEAATAVIYYQKAVDLGYSEAQTHLTKVIFQSEISHKQALALVKEQEAKPVPGTESRAQKKAQITPVPRAESLVQEKQETPPVPIALSRVQEKQETKPVSGAESLVQKEPQITPVPRAESITQKEPQVTPVPRAESITQKKPQIMPVPSTDSLFQQFRRAPIAEPEKALVDLKQKAPIAYQQDDQPTMTVTLTEIAGQCQNFTQTGFDLYAVTIKGAFLTGTAVLVAKRPDFSKSGTYLVNLTSDKSDTVLLDLHDVPGEIASRYAKGDKFRVTGIVIDSKVVGSGCTLKLKYESVNI